MLGYLFSGRRISANQSNEKVAGTLRLDLASYRELEALHNLALDLDAATQAN